MIWLNNAATSFPKPQAVRDCVNACIDHMPCSDGRSSLLGRDALEDARCIAASFFGVRKAERIHFLSGATEAANLIISGLGIGKQAVLATSLEHNCILRPLFSRLERSQIGIVHPDESGRIPSSAIPSFAGAKFFFLNHSSNVTGAVQDAKGLFAEAHRLGMACILDFSQTAGTFPVDLDDIEADVAFCACHKGLLGVPGCAVMYLRDSSLVKPSFFGGTGEHGDVLDMRNSGVFEVGTMNQAAVSALSCGISFIQELGTEKVFGSVSSKVMHIKMELSCLSRIRLASPLEGPCTNAVSFVIDGISPSDAAFILRDSYQIIVRSGLMCAPLAMKDLGLVEGAVRVSPSYLTSDSEIQSFIDAMKDISRSISRSIE
ncbi:MAG: aminotransferase class V-fold PLP-dependent enzyme [Sphaerochaetaceae bacterium]|nr:aminotransferase class V-fold PLP-dependent enzyme [Sphaerochaetaceae bacterium]